MILGEILKKRNEFLIHGGRGVRLTGSSWFSLTLPGIVILDLGHGSSLKTSEVPLMTLSDINATLEQQIFNLPQ